MNPRSWGVVALAALGAIGGGLVGAELLVRGLDLFAEQRAIASREPPPRVGPEEAGESIRTQLHPFLGWSQRPGVPVVFALENRDELFANGELTPWAKQSVERNAQGKVSPVSDYRDVDPSQFVVGLFGGSVAEHLALLAGDVLVEAIERRIPQVAGHVVLLSFGEGGYKQPQQLLGLTEMALLGIPFDTVINLDGVNEVALGAADCVRGHHPLMPSRRHLRTVAKTFRGDSLDWTLRTAEIVGHQQAAERWLAGVSSRPVLRNSELVKAVAGAVAERHLLQSTLLEDELQQNAAELSDEEGFLAEPPHESGLSLDACVGEAADLWERSSLLMDATADRIGATYLHFLQPNQHVAGSKPLTSKERAIAETAGAWGKRVAIGLPRLRLRGDRLRNEGVRFVDLTMVFAEHHETFYWDACCHINHAGNVALAEAIAEHVPGPTERPARPRRLR